MHCRMTYLLIYYQSHMRISYRCLDIVTPCQRSYVWKHMEEEKPWRYNYERYFNETVTLSRCSLLTSDKKMEP